MSSTAELLPDAKAALTSAVRLRDYGEVARILSASIVPEVEPAPIEMDPRPCELCGLTIDRHRMVDNGEGPEFWCLDLSPDEMTLPELERRDELRRQEDIAAILAGWLEPADAPSITPPDGGPPSSRPAQSTIVAFRLVAAAGDVGRLKAWLADRPKDAPFLIALLESPAPC